MKTKSDIQVFLSTGGLRVNNDKYLQYKRDDAGNYYISLDGINYHLIEVSSLRHISAVFQIWSKRSGK